MSDFFAKLRRKLVKLRLQPIRVFCFHHVCQNFDAELMYACDWMQIDEFISKVLAMQRDGVEFISLSEAYHHICRDFFRRRKYAVISFDDGYASLREILSWLEEQHIPATLFINGKYLDGISYRENSNEKYLTKEELFQLKSPLIEIGSHGWEHTNAQQMTESAFIDAMKQNIELLSRHPRYIPFHAYTWGRHTEVTDVYLQSIGIIPVYMNGMKNYNNSHVVHRELLN